MSKPNYRVILSYDAERKVFSARAPELEHCTGEGATRAEAISRVEEEIEAQLANMLSHGTTPPRSVDEETFSGELNGIKVSKLLHRDLAYQARSEGVELSHLLGELLSAAMESRRQTRMPRSGNRQPQQHEPHDSIGNRQEGGGGGGRGRGGFGGPGRGNYHQVMDDRASFMEYVRGLEQGGGHGPGRGGGGPGGPGGGGDRGRRRRRGGGGGGGGGGGNPPFHGRNEGRNEGHRGGGMHAGGGQNGQPGQNGMAPRHAAPSEGSGGQGGSHGAPPSGGGAPNGGSAGGTPGDNSGNS